MLTWLGQRPAKQRRAARPAAAPAEPQRYRVPKDEPYVPTAEDELPPPFFADTDEAFLDLNDEPAAMSPPPLPRPFSPVEDAMPRTTAELEAKIAGDLAALPPFPEPDAVNRGDTLRQILVDLDRITGDFCTLLTPAHHP